MSIQAKSWKKVVVLTGLVAAGAWVMLLYRPPSSQAGMRRRPSVAPEPPTQLDVPPSPSVPAADNGKQAASSAPAPPSTAFAQPMPSPEGMKRNGELVAAQVSLLEQVLNETGSDAGAGRAEKLLTGAYAAEDFGGAAFTASCRATLCRIAMEPGPNDAAKASIQHMSSYAPWSASGFTHVDLATEKTTFYIAREGHELPLAQVADPGQQAAAR